MSTNNNFLTVERQHRFDGRDYPVPSHIHKSYEFIKNVERSLDGTLHVDAECQKVNLQVVFEYLDSVELNKIERLFDTGKQKGLQVEYLNDAQSATPSSSRYFVDNIGFEPWVVDSSIHWRNVTVDLIEI